ncbi:MAG: BLUF domain-containing protein [Proteobacteria bacterium]|nr:BLUF domain-containing protein [Pseudomonadota bacterium]
MYELIYCSHATKDFSEDELVEMLTTFRACNNVHKVSGILVYDKMEFIQLIEGEKKTIQQLYNNICNDKRHSNINLFFEGPIRDRNFPDWSMGFIRNKKLGQKIIGYSDIFDQNLSAVITDKQHSIGTHLFKVLCASLYFDRFGNMLS